MSGNLTSLSKVMDEIKGRLDEYEQNLYNSAEENIKQGDYYMGMTQ